MKTINRLTVGLSKEDLRKIESLAYEFGESKASIVQQAVRNYYIQHMITKMYADNYKFPGILNSKEDQNWTCDD